MLDELGTREGEPLVLKAVEDLKLHGGSPRIIITPRPNDPDEVRHKPPLVKTQGRTLVVSRVLASVLDTYGMRHRAKLKGAKRQPFFFMGTKGDGAAMTLDSVYDIFEVLRLRFPNDLPSDLNPHKMRHTWNARFREKAAVLGWSDGYREIINNYLMGWAKNSKQSANYSHSEIVKEAERILLDLQGKIEATA
jgi:integrase